jgi:hypothetical protein
MASIEPHGDFGYPGYTLQPPFRIALTEFYSREIHFDPWSVRTEPDGIALFIDTYDRTARLRPMKHAAIVEALFGEAKMSLQTSVGGRLANRLLEALGGYEATRVFKIRGVRNLIAQFDSQTPIGRGEATNAIWNDGQFRDHEGLYIERRDTPTLSAAATLDFLLKHDFYRAGLEFKCDNCGLTNWLSLRQVDDRWICEYCGHGGITSLHVRDRGDWKFRKSGLLAKDNNQEGAIPVLLSLLTLGRIFNDRRLLRLTSVNVQLTGVPPCEIDFTAVHHHHGEISCGIGEAKAAGGKIDGNDVKNLKTVADALKKADIAPYLVFSKTADAFLPPEIALFRTARDEGYDVILLTNGRWSRTTRITRAQTRTACPVPMHIRSTKWSRIRRFATLASISSEDSVSTTLSQKRWRRERLASPTAPCRPHHKAATAPIGQHDEDRGRRTATRRLARPRWWRSPRGWRRE